MKLSQNETCFLTCSHRRQCLNAQAPNLTSHHMQPPVTNGWLARFSLSVTTACSELQIHQTFQRTLHLSLPKLPIQVAVMLVTVPISHTACKEFLLESKAQVAKSIAARSTHKIALPLQTAALCQVNWQWRLWSNLCLWLQKTLQKLNLDAVLCHSDCHTFSDLCCHTAAASSSCWSSVFNCHAN